MATEPTDPKDDARWRRDLRFALFYLGFFLALLLIASFGLIAEA